MMPPLFLSFGKIITYSLFSCFADKHTSLRGISYIWFDRTTSRFFRGCKEGLASVCRGNVSEVVLKSFNSYVIVETIPKILRAFISFLIAKLVKNCEQSQFFFLKVVRPSEMASQ